MKRTQLSRLIVSIVIASLATAAAAQKSGGTLRMSLNQNPGSASLLEETSVSVNQPFMPVYNACWYPHVKGYVKAANGSYTHNRMEYVWLDK